MVSEDQEQPPQVYHLLSPCKGTRDPAKSMCVLRYERGNAQDGREIGFPRERGKGRQSRSPRRTPSLRPSLAAPRELKMRRKSVFTYKRCSGDTMQTPRLLLPQP